MQLIRRFDKILVLFFMTALILSFVFLAKVSSLKTFADSNEEVLVNDSANFVTFYDDGNKLTIKTNVKTVGDALERVGIIINEGDIVEPSLDSEINADNFFINIFRSRPVIIKDGLNEKYVMTASYNPSEFFAEAGVTVYDGDEIKLVPNTNFLEAGVATVYEITRNGGREVTVEEEIPFTEETVRDFNLASGSSEEIGRAHV